MINDCVTLLAHHRPLPSLQMLPPASLRPDHKDLKHKQKHVIRIVKKAEIENLINPAKKSPLTASLRPDHKDLKHKHNLIRVVDKYLDKELNPTKLISLHVHNLRLKEMVKEIAQNEFDHFFVF